MIQRNAAGALQELDAAVGEGVDPGQLAEQLLGYLRDMMALSIGGPVDLMRTANPNGADALRDSGKSWGTMTLLSAMQLLDETIARMKHSVQPRILLEVALVQICNLQDLQLLSDVVRGLASGHRPNVSVATSLQSLPVPAIPIVAATNSSPTAPTAPKVSTAPPPSADRTEPSITKPLPESQTGAPTSVSMATPGSPPHETTVSREAGSKKKEDELISAEAALEIFRRVVGKIEGVVQQAAWMTLEIQPTSSRRWRVLLARDAKFAIDWFRKPENHRLIQSAIREDLGNEVEFEWMVTNRELPPGAKPAEEVVAAPQVQRAVSTAGSNQRIRDAMGHPLVQKFMSTFEGHVFRVDDPPSAIMPPPKTASTEDLERDISFEP
jgi:DNA polymerase-3 subunit gamma/tau